MSEEDAARKSTLHPTYNEMIIEAITSMRKKTGSSRQAIAKYLIANYKVSNGYEVHLKKGLKRLVKNQQLIQTRGTGALGSFKLNKTTLTSPSKKKIKKNQTKDTVEKVPDESYQAIVSNPDDVAAVASNPDVVAATVKAIKSKEDANAKSSTRNNSAAVSPIKKSVKFIKAESENSTTKVETRMTQSGVRELREVSVSKEKLPPKKVRSSKKNKTS